MSIDFTTLTNAVTNTNSVEASAIILIQGIAAQLQAAVANADTNTQAKINALVTQLNAESAAPAAAIAANIPGPIANTVPVSPPPRLLLTNRSSSASAAPPPANTTPENIDWQTVKLGGGGLHTGVDVNQNTGEHITRTDTYGCYLWDPIANASFQMLRYSAMPSNYFGVVGPPGNQTACLAGGVFEARSAWSNSDYQYFIWGDKMYMSSNHANTFQALAPLPVTYMTVSSITDEQSQIYVGLTANFPLNSANQTPIFNGQSFFDITNVSATANAGAFVQGTNGANGFVTTANNTVLPIKIGDILGFGFNTYIDNYRNIGSRFAINPLNPTELYVGLQDRGLWHIANAAALIWDNINKPTGQWTPVTSVPIAPPDSSGSNFPGYLVDWHPTNTNIIYVFGYDTANGADAGSLYVCMNNDQNFVKIANSPLNASSLKVAWDGNVYLVDGSGIGWKYSGGPTGTWTNEEVGFDAHYVAVNKWQANNVLWLNGAQINNQGGTGNTQPAYRYTSDVEQYIVQLDWLGGGGGGYFDPLVNATPYQVVATSGQGIYQALLTGNSTLNFIDMDQGIEDMVSVSGISINGIPIFGFEDCGFIRSEDPALSQYPLTEQVNVWGQSQALNFGNEIDYAGSNNQILMQISNATEEWDALASGGMSHDQGKTWLPFSSWYATVNLAAFSSSGIVNPGWGGNNFYPVVTLSGGQTTEGLTSFNAANGGGSMVRIDYLSPKGWGNTSSSNNQIYSMFDFSKYYYANVTSNNTLTLMGGIVYIDPQYCVDGTYQIYKDDMVYTDCRGDLGNCITSITADTSNQVVVGVSNSAFGIIYQIPVKISNVKGATYVNGEWFATNPVGNSTGWFFTLSGSVFNPNEPFTGGGDILSVQQPGGCAALDASGTSVIVIPSNSEMPWYTNNNGKNWTKLISSDGLGWPATEYASGGTWSNNVVNIFTNINHGLGPNSFIQVQNGGNLGDGNLPLSNGTSGNVFVIDLPPTIANTSAAGQTVVNLNPTGAPDNWHSQNGQQYWYLMYPWSDNGFSNNLVVHNVTNPGSIAANTIVVGTHPDNFASTITLSQPLLEEIKAGDILTFSTTLGPMNVQAGFPWAYYLNAHIVCADRVEPDTFYIFNFIYGIFQVKNGITTRLDPTGNASAFNNIMKAVPGKAGEFFIIQGESGGSTNHPSLGCQLFHYKVGTGWSVVSGIQEPWGFDIGAQAPDGTYPTIGVIGWYNLQYGFWISKDGGASFEMLGTAKLDGLADSPRTVVGDIEIWNRWYIGGGGGSFQVYPAKAA